MFEYECYGGEKSTRQAFLYNIQCPILGVRVIFLNYVFLADEHKNNGDQRGLKGIII